MDVWTLLVEDGNWALIDKLRMVEAGEVGFGTIVNPRGGFSTRDDVHNAVLDWLEEHKVNVFNPGLLIARMNVALHGYQE